MLVLEGEMHLEGLHHIQGTSPDKSSSLWGPLFHVPGTVPGAKGDQRREEPSHALK